MLPPANVGERPRTGPVDCLFLIIAVEERHGEAAARGCPLKKLEQTSATHRIAFRISCGPVARA